MKHYDLIIANPPYGPIGARITENVLDGIDFGEYVNLEPSNDFVRSRVRNHILTAEDVNGAFEDAAVTTTAMKIAKRKVASISGVEAMVMSKPESIMKRYFLENCLRGVPYSDYKQSDVAFATGLKDPSLVVCLGHRDYNHGGLPKAKQRDYLFNKGLISRKDLISMIARSGPDNIYTSDIYTFSSARSRSNFVDFLYSRDGYRFFSYLCRKAHVDSTSARLYVLPAVDWERSWTVEEILRDYRYSDIEIDQIMAELRSSEYYDLSDMPDDEAVEVFKQKLAAYLASKGDGEK